MKVIITDQARNDLREISRFIARDNPARARTFTLELRDKARAIGDKPYGSAVLPRYEHQGVRRRPYRDYVILYKVQAEQVFIMHLLHSARDIDELL